MAYINTKLSVDDVVVFELICTFIYISRLQIPQLIHRIFYLIVEFWVLILIK